MSKEIPGVFQDDPKMSSEDLKKIDILSASVCSGKWISYVSAVNHHFMKMHDDEWPSRIVTANNCWYQWLDDWNKNDFSGFSSRLQSIKIPDKSTLYIFWMQEVGIKTNWSVFCRNWGNFVYEDEGCILVLPEYENSLVLSNGSAWIGKRSASKT